MTTTTPPQQGSAWRKVKAAARTLVKVATGVTALASALKVVTSIFG